MKKLLTLTFVIAALIIGAVSVQAQSYKYKKIKAVKHNKYKKNNNYGNYNRRGVYTYHKTKYVWHYGRKYKKTYKVKVFPNGRKKVKLINVQRVSRYHGARTYYTSKIVRYGWKTYRLTYKVKQYRNGRVKKKLVKKTRIYNRYNW